MQCISELCFSRTRTSNGFCFESRITTPIKLIARSIDVAVWHTGTIMAAPRATSLERSASPERLRSRPRLQTSPPALRRARRSVEESARRQHESRARAHRLHAARRPRSILTLPHTPRSSSALASFAPLPRLRRLGALNAWGCAETSARCPVGLWCRPASSRSVARRSRAGCFQSVSTRYLAQ